MIDTLLNSFFAFFLLSVDHNSEIHCVNNILQFKGSYNEYCNAAPERCWQIFGQHRRVYFTLWSHFGHDVKWTH